MSKLKVDSKVPEFEGKDENGKSIKWSDFKGKKLVMYFYPKDMTPGCTNQACNLKENYDELIKNGFEIVGVSADDGIRHQKFISKYELPFHLIADTDKEIINQFGVWGPKKFMGKEYEGIIRTTFVINEEGIVSSVIEKVKTKDHSQQILDTIA